MATNPVVDFGYPWWLGYGHLPILGASAALLVVSYTRKWPFWVSAAAGIVAVWALAAFGVVRFVIDINGRPVLPTPNFFTSGVGRVLDIGAGTGRSSIMVLQARPRATLVASDLFGESFEQHFGKRGSPQERLLANLRAAGVERRASIETADMRKLPFGTASFDAVISAYTMEHVNRRGTDEALSEAARVVKAGGDFLLMVVASERWARFAFGPLLAHGGARGSDWWTSHVEGAGFRVLESGTRPLTLYVLARREVPRKEHGEDR